jgi:superfamily II DNA or RNA helicase
VEHADREFIPSAWASESGVVDRVRRKTEEALASYAADPLLVQEHANKELGTAQGGYGRRQIYELVQNAADELIDQAGGSVKVLLTDRALYCANEGSPISEAGVNAILMSDLSVKRGNEIGRFGLGFKSVLAITRRPLFLSRSGSFRFDPGEAEAMIRAIVPDAERIPYLRTAIAVDPTAEATQDEVLLELMRWATTVVKLPLDEPASEWLHADLADFPAEFLLFSPHVGRVVLEDRTQGVYREVLVRSEDETCFLSEHGREQAWRLFRVDHVPSPAALEDAGEIARRDQVPVIWAVPQDGLRGRGRFWAFFPTSMETTLTGIINAPWKTNEDRQNLLPGPFNEELLDVVAQLVVDGIPALATVDDPGRVFDILPARGREAPSWADTRITSSIYEKASERPSIPDQDGELVLPDTLRLPPDDLPPEALAHWASYEGRPRNWTHTSIETRERRPRVERLVDQSQVATHAQWLAALVEDQTPDSSIAAVKALGSVLGVARPADAADAKRAKIVLTTDGSLVAPDASQVFTSLSPTDSNLAKFVHPSLEDDPDVLRILATLGIASVDPSAEYALYLNEMTWSFSDWEGFWANTEKVDTRRAVDLIERREGLASRIRFKSVAGTWVSRAAILLPGPIVPEDGGEDARTTLDIRFHAATLHVVEGLGVRAAPAHDGMVAGEAWYQTYESEALQWYTDATKSLRQRPSVDYLLLNHRGVLGPLDPMRHLSKAASVRFTGAILNTDPDERQWTMSHATMGVYPTVDVEDPVTWFVKRYGWLETTLGPRPVSGAVAPNLDDLSAVLPVASCPHAWVDRLTLPMSLGEIGVELWNEGIETALQLDDERELASFYAAASRYVSAPALIRCRVGAALEAVIPPQVSVVSDAATRDALVDGSVPFLYVPRPEDGAELASRWGLISHAGLIESHADPVPIGDPQPLVDEYPALRAFLSRAASQLQLVRCAELRREVVGPTGRQVQPAELLVDGEVVYWLDDGDDHRFLQRLSEELRLGLTDDDLDSVLSNRLDNRRRSLLVAVREADEPPVKLLRALGRDAIIRRIRADLLAGVEESRGALDDEGTSRLAAAIFGIDLFREFRLELEQAGLAPPVQWAGSRAARRFVHDLGLPREYAGFEEPRRDPLWEVDGPAVLPPLHEFQKELTGRIGELIGRADRKRALLSLPTGAGKTRVTVQSLVEAIRDDGLSGPLLWIAPTGELCEQAVQTWAYVWRAIGPQARLHISRLWENREADEMADGVQVVIGTDAKLGIVRQRSQYEWLAEASCVVVDEAHGSTETGYTQILHWLGLGTDQKKDRCPLIGLTATPFKGLSEDATERLARRYGSRKLDDGVLGPEPYRRLQEMGVLAQVAQRVLGGSTIELTPEQAETVNRTNRLPPDVEERLGADRSRNEVILETILGLPADWKILVFAASVSHAEQLAAILNLDGVPSAAVSAGTNPAARRHYVRQFNHGPLRVLTNYGVLAEGFDAPSVRAVIVARPTLSPNAYQQMIGRGLRGPKNGGKEECLIVNVADNIIRYGGTLAFRHFDYLFADQAPASS